MQTRTALGWTRRVERAKRLREGNTALEQLIGFYEDVLRVQSAIAEEFASSGTARFDANFPFVEQLNCEIPLRHLPELAELTRRQTDVLANAAQKFTEPSVLRATMAELLDQTELAPEQAPERFFVLALLQPAAEFLASAIPATLETKSRCPVCGALPLLAILRPEGDGAKRFLQCSLCLTEWSYLRVLCAWCGESDKDKLPRYSAEECNYVRVEACDTCKHYLKSIDQTVDGNAIAMVDEVALSALDVWATDQGFKKITQNLLGI